MSIKKVVAVSSSVTSPALDSTLLLDIKGSSRVLGLTPWQVRGLIANSELPIVKIGNKFYVRRTTLVRWLERAEEGVR